MLGLLEEEILGTGAEQEQEREGRRPTVVEEDEGHITDTENDEEQNDEEDSLEEEEDVEEADEPRIISTRTEESTEVRRRSRRLAGRRIREDDEEDSLEEGQDLEIAEEEEEQDEDSSSASSSSSEYTSWNRVQYKVRNKRNDTTCEI